MRKKGIEAVINRTPLGEVRSFEPLPLKPSLWPNALDYLGFVWHCVMVNPDHRE